MIGRQLYIERLFPFIDKPFVKVITGLRRCGKSVLLMMLRNELLERKIAEDCIIYINFESFEHSEIDTPKKFYETIKSKITGTNKHYLLVDEVQEVEGWEKVINSCMVDFDIDIYITGSNSHILSSELATFLAGRYVEIHIQTLSFNEYLQFKNVYNNSVLSESNKTEFQSFLRLGGFPVIHTAPYSAENAYKIVYDIYSSAILRDTVQRHNIRDVELLERVVKFILDNIGNCFSAKNIADYFKSQYRKVDLNTIYNYLQALEAAFIVYKTHRYDVVGKEILKTQEKYYVGDQSILYAVMGVKDRNISGVLENIVMLELKRRGYAVYVGKLDKREIDFIAIKQDKKIYVQVTYKLAEPATIEREYSPLLSIRDQYPKYVVSMDETWNDNIEGVPHVHIADFLLANYY
ncbi:MAG: ATP-binding protein [Bacteroidales bacterium]|nr:ATP-binding protein [Bacteroidales bacterium]